jgi:RNA polymerase sigma-70 factor (ECF subfamily)
MSEFGDDVVARAQRGDRLAVEEVLQAVRRVAIRYCRSRLAGPGEGFGIADDVAQEICLAVYRGLPRVRGPLVAYVYGVASRKVADALRERPLRVYPLETVEQRADPRPGPEETVIASARVAGLLDELSPVQREVLVLRVMVGLTALETGLALGLHAGNVRLIQHRALNVLRERVSGASVD